MTVIDFIISVLYGIVEGITEWFPVSSTGHLILLDSFLHLNVSEEFYELYLVVIQLGAIMAVVIIYWNEIWPFGIKDNPHPWKSEGVGRWVKADKFVMWFKILVACIPAVVVGLIFDDFLDELFYNWICVSIMLILFGIAFIGVEKWVKGKKPYVTSVDQITYPQALLIGAFQLIAAVFPGTSRSGSTIVGSLAMGISREVAAKFTFFLAIPVMFGASLLKILKYDGEGVSGAEIAMLATGMMVAFLVSWFVIKKFMSYIRKHNFNVFGWYRIGAGVLFLILGIAGLLKMG